MMPNGSVFLLLFIRLNFSCNSSHKLDDRYQVVGMTDDLDEIDIDDRRYFLHSFVNEKQMTQNENSRGLYYIFHYFAVIS